jgi:outer membrane lipoprotein carrier protein
MFKKLLAIVTSFFFSYTIFADPAQELNQHLSEFNSMTAQFSQVLYDANGKAMQKSSGEMALKRPGKFRWDLKNPNPQLLIADGNTVWVYDRDLKQATHQKMDQNNTSSAASLLSGSVGDVESRFNVTYPKNETKNGQWFMLKPKNKNDMFQWVELHFVNNTLADMRLYDNMDTLTDFHFSNVKVNPTLDESLFKFKAPKGVEIIKNK